MTNAPTPRETADHAELAACPFCGGTAKSETLGHGKSARTGVKCADVDCPGSMRLVGADEDGVAFWNRRPCEAALLSEIAALRGALAEAERDASSWSRCAGEVVTIGESWKERFVQAERQRDELRKALETISGPPEEPWERDHMLPPRYLPRWSAPQCRDIARQALANQGADQ